MTLQGGLGALEPAHAAGARVYVFAISNVRPHVLQKMLEQAMPGVTVDVFGRVGDFSRALEESPPDAAVALAPVLESLGHKPVVQGAHGGSPIEPCVILSEADIRPDQLSRIRIGCIDYVGRKKLPAFVAALLGVDSVAEVQRVTKIEDLLQLLQFDRADAILLPERFLPEIRELTKMSFKLTRPAGVKMLRTAIAFPAGRHPVEQTIRGLSKGIIEHLGVDSWS